MFLNVDQLEKRLDKEEFQEIGSMAAFKYFLEYTQLEIREFRDTLIQHMEYVKKSIDKRALHKRDYDSRVNERQMQTTEGKVDTSNALDVSLVNTKSSGTSSGEQDTSSISGNDAHVDDADIRPIYNEEPMAEVKLTAEYNVFATGQQHTKQPEFNNEGEVDQNVKQCHDIRTLPAQLTNNHITKLSYQSIESENICLKKIVAQFQKDFLRMEAHCVNLDLKYQNQALKEGQHGQFQMKRVMNPRISKSRFASQVDMNNDLSKPVTTHYLPKERESAIVKPHHMIAPSSSRYSLNDMVHNHYLEEAKKKTQESGKNSIPSVMPSARSQSTTNDSKPKPRINYQNSRNWPASKSSCVTTKTVPIVEHSKSSRNFSDSKHFVCSTCQKCIFNVTHDSCVTKFLNEVNSHAKVPSNMITHRNKPVEQISIAKKLERQIPTGHRFSIKKTSTVHEKTTCPRSCLSEPTNDSNEDITNQYECEQTLNVSASTLNLSASTSFNPKKEGLRVCSELGIHDHSNEPSSSKLVPKVVPPVDKTSTSQQELELLFSLLTNGNPSRVNLKQLCGRYKRRCCSLILAESDSLSHAHAQTTKTYYKHQDSRIKKAQELKTNTSANSDIKDPSSETKIRGRLLESFQEDAKYEHVGQDTGSQDGKDDKDKQRKDLKISELKTKSKDNDKG
ncbi:hypothetical protein Tco_0653682 [Tanacetum coccineum]|uniref:Uncharacterized protein n=1 Tax=Tanacetum coccineum TaxID=301880 RepID=A0ABQ4X1H9_9ASTR